MEDYDTQRNIKAIASNLADLVISLQQIAESQQAIAKALVSIEKNGINVVVYES